MNLRELWEALAASITSIFNMGWQKLTIAAAAAIASEVFGTHAELLSCFVALVVCDLLTKWVGLANKYLVEKKNKESPTLIQCIKAVPKARRAGYINSEIMKHRFLGKIITYIFAMIIAGIVDNMFRTLNNPALIVNLTVSYLAVTELISILENMEDAGVEACGQLVDLIKKKTGMGKQKDGGNNV